MAYVVAFLLLGSYYTTTIQPNGYVKQWPTIWSNSQQRSSFYNLFGGPGAIKLKKCIKQQLLELLLLTDISSFGSVWKLFRLAHSLLLLIFK